MRAALCFPCFSHRLQAASGLGTWQVARIYTLPDDIMLIESGEQPFTRRTGVVQRRLGSAFVLSVEVIEMCQQLKHNNYSWSSRGFFRDVLQFATRALVYGCCASQCSESRASTRRFLGFLSVEHVKESECCRQSVTQKSPKKQRRKTFK